MSEANQGKKIPPQAVPDRQPEMSWEMAVRTVERRMMEKAFQMVGQKTDVNGKFRDPQKAERFQFPEFKSREVLKALNDLKQRGYSAVVVQSQNPEFMRRVGIMTESLGMATNVRLSTGEKSLVKELREKNPWTVVNLRVNQLDHGLVQ